jgi:hypothetical protein
MMRHWNTIVETLYEGGPYLPLLLEDPKPITPEQREDVITHMAAGLLQIHRYYLSQRQSSMPRDPSNSGARGRVPWSASHAVARSAICRVTLPGAPSCHAGSRV